MSAAFDEAVKGNGSQDLYLGGNTLRITNVSNCQGAVTNEQAMTVNAVFNVSVTAGGTMDFQ